jgi:hypothetical protein
LSPPFHNDGIWYHCHGANCQPGSEPIYLYCICMAALTLDIKDVGSWHTIVRAEDYSDEYTDVDLEMLRTINAFQLVGSVR